MNNQTDEEEKGNTAPFPLLSDTVELVFQEGRRLEFRVKWRLSEAIQGCVILIPVGIVWTCGVLVAAYAAFVAVSQMEPLAALFATIMSIASIPGVWAIQWLGTLIFQWTSIVDLANREYSMRCGPAWRRCSIPDNGPVVIRIKGTEGGGAVWGCALQVKTSAEPEKWRALTPSMNLSSRSQVKKFGDRVREACDLWDIEDVEVENDIRSRR